MAGHFRAFHNHREQDLRENHPGIYERSHMTFKQYIAQFESDNADEFHTQSTHNQAPEYEDTSEVHEPTAILDRPVTSFPTINRSSKDQSTYPQPNDPLTCQFCGYEVYGAVFLRHFTHHGPGVKVCHVCYATIQTHKQHPYSQVMQRFAILEAGYPINRKLPFGVFHDYTIRQSCKCSK